VAVLTIAHPVAPPAARTPARHRLARRPAHERLADWFDQPHPAFYNYVERLAVSMSVWAFPVTIVAVGIASRGAA
jgi:hypothetical protein